MLSKKVKKAILIGLVCALIVTIICTAGCVSDVFSAGQEMGTSMNLTGLVFDTGKEGI